MVGGVCSRIARLPHAGPHGGRGAAPHCRGDGLVRRQCALRKDRRRSETTSGCQEGHSRVLHVAKKSGTGGSACRPGGSASGESSSRRTSQDERAGRCTRARLVTSTRPPTRAGEGRLRAYLLIHPAQRRVVRSYVLRVSGRVVNTSLLEELEKFRVRASQQFRGNSSRTRAATIERQHRLLSGLLLERFAESVADRVRYVQVELETSHGFAAPEKEST